MPSLIQIIDGGLTQALARNVFSDYYPTTDAFIFLLAKSGPSLFSFAYLVEMDGGIYLSSWRKVED